MSLGEILYNARIARKLSQKQVTARSGVADATLSGIENDRVPNPSFKTIAKLCKAYGLSMDALKYAE